MKPKNFPARKLARQRSAAQRNGTAMPTGNLETARGIRTKKDRSVRGFKT